MFRLTIASIAALLVAPLAHAQPRTPQLPLAPGVMPGSPWGPGMPFVPAGPIPQNSVGRGNQVFFPVALPWGWGVGWGYQTFNPWTGYGYSYGGVLPPGPMVPQTTVVETPRQPDPSVVLANEFPAKLTVQLPAAGEIWLDGKKVSSESSEEQVLISPTLQQNQQYTFLVKARWSRGGKTYEAKRSITLGPGDRSRLAIISGDEVRE